MPAVPVPRGFLTGSPSQALATPMPMIDRGPGTAINADSAPPAGGAGYNATPQILGEQVAKEAITANANKKFNDWVGSQNKEDFDNQFLPKSNIHSSLSGVGANGQPFKGGRDTPNVGAAVAQQIQLQNARAHFMKNILPQDATHQALTTYAGLATRARQATVPISVQAQREASTHTAPPSAVAPSANPLTFNGPLPPTGNEPSVPQPPTFNGPPAPGDHIGTSAYGRAMSQSLPPVAAPADPKNDLAKQAQAWKENPQNPVNVAAAARAEAATRPKEPKATPDRKPTPLKVGYDSPAYKEDIGLWKSQWLAWKKAQGDPITKNGAGIEPTRPSPNDDKYHPPTPESPQGAQSAGGAIRSDETPMAPESTPQTAPVPQQAASTPAPATQPSPQPITTQPAASPAATAPNATAPQPSIASRSGKAIFQHSDGKWYYQ